MGPEVNDLATVPAVSDGRYTPPRRHRAARELPGARHLTHRTRIGDRTPGAEFDTTRHGAALEVRIFGAGY